MPPRSSDSAEPDGKGGWISNLDGVERILNRLPELLAADPAQPVFICEGEKDVDNLAAHGIGSDHQLGRCGEVAPDQGPGRPRGQTGRNSCPTMTPAARASVTPSR